MSVATALVVGNEAWPQLAEEAFRQALAQTGAERANGVLLYLSADFARQAQQSVTAVARAARCTQVLGGIAAGVFTERGWVLDRPAAAAMVLTGGLALSQADVCRPSVGAGADVVLSYTGNALPGEWGEGEEIPMRCGGSFAGRVGSSDRLAWQQARVTEHCGLRMLGATIAVAVSRGWHLLGDPCTVTRSRAYDLLEVSGRPGQDSLSNVLPPEFLRQAPLHLASVCAVVFNSPLGGDAAERQRAFAEGAGHPTAIIAVNGDRSLTLAERLQPGQTVVWAVRSPQAAEEDMRRCVDDLAVAMPAPVAAVLFSCIGRGPYFYDGEDRDVDCLRQRFPALPLIGTYGTGQIAPGPSGRPRLLQNAVVTALIGVSPESRLV